MVPTSCRNCSGHEFYVRDLELKGEVGQMIPAGIFHWPKIRLRVCGTCGLLDYFVQPETLEKVKRKFSKE